MKTWGHTISSYYVIDYMNCIKYRFLLFVLATILTTNLFAQKEATILSHSIDEYYGGGGGLANITSPEGITFHKDFVVQGMLGKTGYVVIYLYDNDENPMKGTSGLTTPSGNLAIAKTFKPNYPSTKYNDFQLTIPCKALGIRSTNDKFQMIKCQIVILDDLGKNILAEKWFGFGYYQKWSTCVNCGGTGKCNVCMGTGWIYIGSYSTPCICNGTGRCGICNGNGDYHQIIFYEKPII